MKGSDEKGWNPYLAGALSGLVLILSVWISGEFFGTSGAFARSVGMIEKLCIPGRVAQMEYFHKVRPVVDWQWMFVAGIFIGSLTSSTTSGSFRWQALPGVWEDRFGKSRVKRGMAAFLGGTLTMFGARLSNGCSSGHGLSGTVQLAVSGLIAMCFFFAGGMIAARILYGGGKKQ